MRQLQPLINNHLERAKEHFAYLEEKPQSIAKFTKSVIDFFDEFWNGTKFTLRASGTIYEQEADIFVGRRNGRLIKHAGLFGCYLIGEFNITADYDDNNVALAEALNYYCRTNGWSRESKNRPSQPFGLLVNQKYEDYFRWFEITDSQMEWVKEDIKTVTEASEEAGGTNIDIRLAEMKGILEIVQTLCPS